MSSPPLAPTPGPATGDSFARVRCALLAVWPSVVHPERGLTTVERNRVLDGCGSDHRPLVELLLDVGRLVQRSLTAHAGRSDASATWQALRAAEVYRLVSTRYLQPEVAQWAVAVWGEALGIGGEERWSPVPAEAPEAVVMRAPSVSAGASPTLAVIPPPAGPTAPGGRAALALPRRTAHMRTAPTGAVVRSGPAGPMWEPHERRAATVVAGALLACILLMSVSVARRSDATTAVIAPIAATPIAATPIAATPIAAPVVVEPVAAEPVVAEPVVAEPMSGGRIVERGVGGRYRVIQRIRAVHGTDNCAAVGAALANGRTTVEVVEHAPGAREFAIRARGVRGVIDGDGVFEADPSAGARNHVRWRFRMRGHFTPTGFTAESETFTDATLRWRQRQSCRVVAVLTATRLPEDSS
jgi:hypothetical protein